MSAVTKCACPVTDRFQCIEIRYGRSHMPDLEFGEIELDDREPCECACHDNDQADWENEDDHHRL